MGNFSYVNNKEGSDLLLDKYGNPQIMSQIKYEDRGWSKIGYDSQPSEISNNVTSMITNYVDVFGQQGFRTTASYSFVSSFLSSFIFFPNFNELAKTNSKFDTSVITDWDGAFNGSKFVIMPDVLDTSGATSMKSMFNGCSCLLNTPSINAIGCSELYRLFADSPSIKQFGKITTNPNTTYNLNQCFYCCSGYSDDFISANIFGYISVNNLNRCFYNIGSKRVDISSLTLTSDCNINEIFSSAKKLEEIKMKNLPTSNLTFNNAIALNRNISKITFIGENTDSFTSIVPSVLKRFIDQSISTKMDIYVKDSVYQTLLSDESFKQNVLDTYPTTKNIHIHNIEE